MTVPDSTNLEELNDRLYRRQAKFSLRRSLLSDVKKTVPRSWADEASPAATPSRPLAKSFKWLKFLFIFSLIFFVAAAGLAALVWYRGGNLVSSANVAFTLTAPSEVRAGEEVILQFEIENLNAAPLEFAELLVEYPPGSKSGAGPTADLVRESFPLGELAAGAKIKQAARVILFAPRDSVLKVAASLEYRLANSNAIFKRSLAHDVKIISTPFNVTVTGPSELTSNQSAAFTIKIVSNVEAPVADAALVMVYPPGFNFKEATPQPTVGNRVWPLGRLAAGDQRTIQVTGVLAGQSGEEKAFRFTIGSLKPGTQDELQVLYGSAVKVVTIQRPQVALNLSVNGRDLPDEVVSNRDLVRVEIDWVNNLSTAVSDAEVLMTLGGVVVDKATVAPSRGFYQSAQNRILWNKTSEAGLAQVAPGATGRVSFTFSLTSLLAGGGNVIGQPTVDLSAEFRGKQTSESGAGTLVASQIRKTIKVNSVVQLGAKVLHGSGAFMNGGPLPPKVGAETAYTVVWSLVNSSNDVANGSVSAVLPPYVRWFNQRVPVDESVRFVPYDSGGGEVIWELSEVRGGTGVNIAVREVSFQIGLTPSVSQVGASPVLVLTPTFQGLDTFTNQTLVTDYKRPLDINLTSDPLFKPGEGRVVE